MCFDIFKNVLFFIILKCVCGDFNNDVYQEKVTFYPDREPGYFGFSVLLSPMGLHVGAPKATYRSARIPTVRLVPLVQKSSGLVFTCPMDSKGAAGNVTCKPIDFPHNMNIVNEMKDDMWLGATIGAVQNDVLFMCAPRWANPHGDKHLLANGACYILTKGRELALFPLRDKLNQAMKTRGERKEYGDYGALLNFYAYGQAGMALKVTDDNHVILGAPGILHWTGGIIDYQSRGGNLGMRKQQITNPYFTLDLGPDDYFGYSVESGVFEDNGTILYIGGAPRSKMGLGQVLVFEPAIRESDPLKIRSSIKGPQLGSYFGAALCTVDVNGDGRTDLFVGAPNFVKKDGGMKYDQGAVFVYLNHNEVNNERNSSFILKLAGYVSGSEENGARFGSSISKLGDIDADGYEDIAVGAPWENEGRGVVYIYQGSKNGLKQQYLHKIVADGARGFGISISKGYDINKDLCNDVAIGAHASGTAYVYKCVPTIKINTTITVPDLKDLPEDATNFTAYFCVAVRFQKWYHVKIEVQATKIIDAELRRASISEDTVTNIVLTPGIQKCEEHVVEVNKTADLTKPISIQYDLKPVNVVHGEVRISEDSTLDSSFLVQMIGDCGKDLICTPWLKMSMEPLDSTYIPGRDNKLGARITIINEEEPAYGAILYLTLPLIPKRVPTSCHLQELNMTCNLPAPLIRNESVDFQIELEYHYSNNDDDLIITAELKEPLYSRNVTDEGVKELTLNVKREVNVTISGKPLPNVTVDVSRETLLGAGNVSFVHYYQITNLGPSDCYNLKGIITLPDMVNLTNPIDKCMDKGRWLECLWSVKAKKTISVTISLHLELSLFGNMLQENSTYNATSTIELYFQQQKEMALVTTTLLLDPATPLWPLIVAVASGFLLLGVIILLMYRLGFFTRKEKEEMKRLLDTTSTVENEPNTSSESNMMAIDDVKDGQDSDEATQELIDHDSD